MITRVPRPACAAVVEESQVGAARRQALGIAEALDFDETRRGRLAVIVTEAAANLARHAQRGTLIIQPFDEGDAGIDVIAVDTGPGMADPTRSLEDGFSTGGTAGTGLGAIRRLADEFDLDSHLGLGTVVFARLWRDADASARRRSWLEVGGISTPIDSEQHVGDDWAANVAGPDRASLIVADGLGHGEDAERAAMRAVEIYRSEHDDPPARQLDHAHAALRGTRGAAMIVAHIERDRAVVAGAGNVAVSIVDGPQTKHAVSHPGIVGHQMGRPQEFTYAWTPRSMLVAASDGVRTQWRFDRYPGLPRRHAAVIAATIWRDFKRGRDDATVVVIRGAGLRSA